VSFSVYDITVPVMVHGLNVMDHSLDHEGMPIVSELREVIGAAKRSGIRGCCKRAGSRGDRPRSHKLLSSCPASRSA
jgi:hypothetical protein